MKIQIDKCVDPDVLEEVVELLADQPVVATGHNIIYIDESHTRIEYDFETLTPPEHGKPWNIQVNCTFRDHARA